MCAAYGSGRCVVDAGDGRYGLGSSGIHHQAVTLTLHALRLLLTDITHPCSSTFYSDDLALLNSGLSVSEVKGLQMVVTHVNTAGQAFCVKAYIKG
jgi:hypothetical protein